MQPGSHGNLPSNQGSSVPLEYRLHLRQIVSRFDDEQLYSVLKNHFKNPSISNHISNFTHEQLLLQCSNLIDNHYSYELEQIIQNVRRKCPSSSNHPRDSYSSTSKQQPVPSQYYNQQPAALNTPPNYRHSSASIPVQQTRTARPNQDVSQFTPNDNPRPHQHPPQSSQNQNSVPRPERPLHSILSSVILPRVSRTPFIQQYQTPLLPPQPVAQAPSSSSSSSSSATVSNSSLPAGVSKILYRSLPFYRPMTPVYERLNIFKVDTSLKQFIAEEEFILPFDVCNQLSLSYDYDPAFDIYTTNKCLLLRLVRIDQPPTFHGNYEDNLPPNLRINANGRSVNTLPVPKANTRQQHDLIRVGREIDITPYCMFNPTLKNDITIVWSCHSDNKLLQQQYAHAKYAIQISLVEHLTIDDLCQHIIQKLVRFSRADLFRILSRARAHDHELDLEVSGHRLKLTCPIDHRRLKIPVRATTCQHLQCFDLINYIGLNEICNKWMCPVCNKPALYEDLQIDSYIESMLKSIENENITEINLNNELHWSPVVPSNMHLVSMAPKSNIRSLPSSNDIILLDDD